ncbi:hypothetical protein [Sporomusa sp. GT1]|nr:hypothetical protein [Sporomusa sp. GT1]
MKKNASFILMDSSLAKYLYNTLQDLHPKSRYANELLQGLADLMEGEVATLMLGMTGQGEHFVNVVDDGIYAGALEIHPKSRKVLHSGIEVSLTPKEFDIL